MANFLAEYEARIFADSVDVVIKFEIPGLVPAHDVALAEGPNEVLEK